MRFQIETPTGLVIRLRIDKIFFTDPQTGSMVTHFRAKSFGFDCGGGTQIKAYDNAVALIFQKRREANLIVGGVGDGNNDI